MNEAANCVVLKPDWWAYDYAYNVCDGSIKKIPWGSLDWIGAIFFYGFFGCLAAFVGFILFLMFCCQPEHVRK